MLPSLRYLLALLLLLALEAYGGEPPLPPLADHAVILAFGDSLTYGTGVSPERSYPAVLQQLSGRQVVNAGVPGEVTAEGRARLAATLQAVKPQLLLLCLGGNDMLRGVSSDEIAQNLEQMVSISREQGVPVVLLGVPRPALLGIKLAPFYPQLAERLQLPLEAEAIPAVLADDRYKSDQLHPNAAGYRRIAEAVYRQLVTRGAL